MSEEKSRELAFLIAQIGHELRTPLNAIKGFGDLLQGEVVGPLNDTQKKYLDKILQSSDGLLRIINQIVDWAKLSSDNMPLHKTSLDIAVLALEAEALFELEAQKKGVHLLVEAPRGYISHVDHDRLRQVLVNLVGNALKFTHAGGSITIRVYDDSENIYVEVADTGCGISESDLARIFDAFVSAHANADGGGEGLGLWISKRIVEAHGGTLTCQSIVHEGSLFLVSLPKEKGGEDV